MVILGIGSIMMATSNVFHSTIASVLQAVLGAIFIVGAIMKKVEERKRAGKASRSFSGEFVDSLQAGPLRQI